MAAGGINARLNYFELPAKHIAASKQFFESALGLSLTSFGPDYAGTVGDPADLGLNGTDDQAITAAMAIFQVDDLEAALAAVEAAGGEITDPIFAFPGGHRFHAKEPSGNIIGVFQADPA